MKYPRKRTIVIVVIILLVIAGFVLGSTKKPTLNYTSAKVDRGDVTQTVSATGAVEAIQKVDLKFLNSGKISEIDTKVGDGVKMGQTLAKLDVSKLDSQLAQSQASLAAADANLRTLLEGASSDDIRLAQTSVDNAQTALDGARQSLNDTNSGTQQDIASAEAALSGAKVTLDNATKNLSNVKSSNDNSLNNTYGAAWDAVSSALATCDDALNANVAVLDNDDAQDTLSVLNSQYLSKSTVSKGVAERARDAAELYVSSVIGSPTPDNISVAIGKTQSALDATQKTLSDTYDVLQATITSAKLTQAELDALKSSISTQRSGVNGAIANLNTKRQAIQTQNVTNQASLDAAQASVNSANSAYISSQNSLLSVRSTAAAKINTAQNAVSAREGDVKQAQEKLNQVKAKPSSSKIAAAQAQVNQARASVDLIQGQINDSTISAPYDGIVTSVVGAVGEIASISDPVISMMIPNGFQITSNISEVSISKVKVDDEVDLSFDALGTDQAFKGKVSEIDPAQTEISGVVYYKITTIFTADGNVVKPGMTANLDVMTAKKENVLRIPFQALKEKDGKKYVQTVNAKTNQITDVYIEVGLKGDTYYEVVSGLEDGQEIATFIQQ